MKTPLRYQVTESDCGTASLINAISYLFEREEIPAELIKLINLYTLDSYDDDGNMGGGGTSQHSMMFFTQWLDGYSMTKKFDIMSERIVTENITIDIMKDCIKDNGVILMRCWQEYEHYVIITKIDKKYIYIFDPYYLEENEYDNDTEVEIVTDSPFTHNRIVSIKRVFEESQEDFSLGKIENRECVLISKKK